MISEAETSQSLCIWGQPGLHRKPQEEEKGKGKEKQKQEQSTQGKVLLTLIMRFTCLDPLSFNALSEVLAD